MMPFSPGESKEQGAVVEGLARNLAREGLDEYTYRVVTAGRLTIAHRFEFGEAYIDAEGIDEIIACVERVMRRVRQSADAAPHPASSRPRLVK